MSYYNNFLPPSSSLSDEEYNNEQEEYDNEEYNNDDEEYNNDDEEYNNDDEEDEDEEEEEDEDEEDDYYEEEDDDGYTELFRNEPIVGKCYFIAYIDSKDIDYSQHNNWKYYAPRNKIIYMGQFERLKRTGGGHTGDITYYFSDGNKVEAEYTPTLCFLEA